MKGSNTIKLFKSTKNGCFEKSLGSTKYKLHEISYDPSDIVNNCCKNLLENLANNTKCSVVLYGPKSTRSLTRNHKEIFDGPHCHEHEGIPAREAG